MNEQGSHPILVAVGNDPVDGALAYAAAEATREGCGLHLVYVVHPVAQGPEMPLVEDVDLVHLGRQMLSGAAELARDLVGEGVPVTTDLAFGGVAGSIVRAAQAGACLIVLQHREMSRLRRVVTRSVTSGVAAHCRVPVVSVPSSWTPARDTSSTVTVGVDFPERSREVLLAAGRAAKARGAQLRVLHTVNIPDTHFEIVVSALDVKEWMDADTAAIQAAIDELGAELADVPVSIDTVQGPAADALLEASTLTDLLVIGRHDPLVPIGSHLGPVARAVLREAHCPVLLADPRPADQWWRVLSP